MRDALKLMAEKDVGALLVIDGERLVGVFSERDYARKGILQGRTSEKTTVGEVMSRKVLYVVPRETLEECMALMTEKHVRHLPVMENERVLGVVTIGDVVKEIISQKSFIIRQLEHYVTFGS